MIIENGYIRFKEKGGGGIDPETGYPMAAESSWGEKMPCQWYRTKGERYRRDREEVSEREELTVLYEGEEEPGSEQLLLEGLGGEEIGEYRIERADVLAAVGEVKLGVFRE